MKRVSKDNVIRFHSMLIECFGGSDGIRDENGLDSALNSAFQTFGGVDLYKTDIQKIASICHSLIANHAFIDGNKRIGIFIMLTLLDLNDYKIHFNQDELIELGLNIANGHTKQSDIIQWVETHLKD